MITVTQILVIIICLIIIIGVCIFWIVRLELKAAALTSRVDDLHNSLKQNKDEHKSLYLKSGSWSSDNNFDLWEKESDNEILNKACEEAYFLFRKKYKMNKTFKNKDLDILKALLLSYNSDGRGWTPLPEHRLFCFNKALYVQSILED